ncbi:hypothetical protein CN447_29000 [Bacillus thuringiensis]|uniref:hypothetical protein n=1 Tax=Bacillus TaxID=1386 RepID=UPI00027BFF7F|nr:MULTISPECIES: hypothetical protein [Bacillus]EJV74915.1 hypothetical protein IGE_05453 [Bacillus cereus HuB1-1]PEW81018.1 hypothetical protein CN447_29000 [Bacillus thuringiensis]HDR8142815.1 hypothetical protein [Bacillus cereus]HDX9688673.1 hypothetical protein [Bacillus thuringiensis]
MLILIEGLDFSGKSTVTPLIIEKLRSMGYSVSHKEGGGLNEGIYRQLVLWSYKQKWLPQNLVQIIYNLSPLVDKITFKRPEFNKGEVHVQQGYIDRVISYNYANHNNFSNWFLRNSYKYFLKFDIKILIVTDLDERIKRYINSGNKNERDEKRFFTTEGLDTFKKIDRYLKKEAKKRNYLIFDNTNHSISETQEKIMQIIIQHIHGITNEE